MAVSNQQHKQSAYACFCGQNLQSMQILNQVKTMSIELKISKLWKPLTATCKKNLVKKKDSCYFPSCSLGVLFSLQKFLFLLKKVFSTSRHFLQRNKEKIFLRENIFWKRKTI